MDSPIQTYLQALHDEIAGIRDGTPDSSIPGIAGVDPDRFGICLATADGYVYEVGDTREDFTIQSISKPLTYGLALADLGAEAVDGKIDVEPSGDAFNELSLAEGTGRPANAMINAGAIAAASLVKGRGGSSRFERILKTYSDFAGRELDYSARVYESERRSGFRNYAMGYLLRQFNILEQDPVPVLEDYFRQCSVLVTCRDLAMVAATLANAGANPVSGKQVLELDVVERVLSVMATCGMYDDAGSWLSSVGMPAKSGVGGGIIAVLPGQVGVGIYAPPLDGHGTSVRGAAACRRLSRDLGLHFVHAARTGRSAIHASYDITAAPSGIRRNDEGAEVLRSHGHRARIIELNGDLLFAGTESVIREVSAQSPDVELVILDLRRVDETGRVAAKLLPRLRDALADAGCGLLLIDPGGVLAGALGSSEDGGDGCAPAFGTRRAAVEDAENQLIARYGSELCLPETVAVPDSPALGSLDPAVAKALAERMEPREYDDGDVIRRAGQRFGGIYFISSGKVASSLPAPGGGRIRISTLSAGMTFGELALASDDRQETTVKAVGPVQVSVLTAEAMAEIEAGDPRLAVELWKTLTRDAYVRVDQYLRETAIRDDGR
ncbi:glutaminase A [Arthrobacter mangrovi]|uniref:Glutaminase n=1 Tax=Arthrobacter mangrovi TaxID=2966350 RepID=A0ABQ5MUT6_9MICC|nr:glutaminase A [Arthrobacter mangrovi]GLB67710.1 glutaminase 1 [Arthrobacter mangrovi]